MTDGIVWEDDPTPGNVKYEPLLGQIKAAQLGSDERRSQWAKVNTFDNDASARDTAYRLGKRWDEFDFISRKDDDGVTVFARLKEGVTA